jgi:hypothetical protein
MYLVSPYKISAHFDIKVWLISQNWLIDILRLNSDLTWFVSSTFHEDKGILIIESACISWKREFSKFQSHLVLLSIIRSLTSIDSSPFIIRVSIYLLELLFNHAVDHTITLLLVPIHHLMPFISSSLELRIFCQT